MQAQIGILLAVALLVLPVQAQEVTLTGAEPTATSNPLLLRSALSKTQELSLSLEKALQIAQENNPDYKASLSVIKQARAAYLTQLASLLPDVGATLPYIHFQGAFPLSAALGGGLNNSSGVGFGGAAVPLSSGFTLYQPQFTVSYQFFQGGSRIFQILAARKTLSAQKALSTLTLQQTLQQTALAYYNLQRQLDQITIAQKQEQESSEQLAINKARLEAGVGTDLDVMQSQAQLAQAHQQLLAANQSAESASASLNQILSLPAIVAVAPEITKQEKKTLVPLGGDFPKLVEVGHRNRPEVHQLEAQIASLKNSRNVALSGYLPQGNFQYSKGRLGESLRDTQPFSLISLSAGLNYKNLGVSGITQFRQGSAQVEEQYYRLTSQLNAIDKEIADAYLQALTTAAQIDTAQIQVTASQKALSDAIERLQAGVGRNIDVTDAETKLTQARTNLSQAIADYNQAQVNLVFNLGLASVESLTHGVTIP